MLIAVLSSTDSYMQILHSDFTLRFFICLIIFIMYHHVLAFVRLKYIKLLEVQFHDLVIVKILFLCVTLVHLTFNLFIACVLVLLGP